MPANGLNLSVEHYDGFKVIFGGQGFDLTPSASLLIEGQAGVGKTVLALQIACKFLGVCSKDQYVLYFAFEQDAEALQSLLQRFQLGGEVCVCGTNPGHRRDPKKLHIVSRPRSDSLSAFVDYTGGLLSKNQGCALLLLDSIGVFEAPDGGTSRKELDRLCQLAREGRYALVMVREKEPEAAAAVAEYVTDSVFELQLKPIAYGPQVRTIEIKKSRIQRSLRGPHEFEILDRLGIAPFPFPDSGFGREEQAGPSAPTAILDLFDGEGADLLRSQLVRSDDSIGKQGLRRGECLLLYGKPGSLKTAFAFNFLKLALSDRNEATLFVTFKIDEQALLGIGRSYLSDAEFDVWWHQNIFIDARPTFWTPARVLAEIRRRVLMRRTSGQLRVERAVVFGLGMIDELPAFQGQELTFLQVLLRYFNSEHMSAMFIDWPRRGRRDSKLQFDSIVNYFPTAIERVQPDSSDLLVQVTRHQFQVAKSPRTLRVLERTLPNGKRALAIEEYSPPAKGAGGARSKVFKAGSQGQDAP
ncbi:MAG: ATPase domain-containing protein [Candidatus Binatia bacterium]